ncbi:MAG: hypothetical protein IPF95_18160 [Flavobacteriales bacterium]|nr:hypothetical protein [Flavobacteriales bacterium]MBK6946328.1 hypothetical protein [Flavobacteriales bacterium]MBK9536378.1 hypothetical protein [Flavobacteriales bacterium]MBP9139387.1 hypothetical protein [Flavobacteriales bacterium]HQV50628.1 hypothetical protein [Flavobacteriales bacterium]
MKFIPAMALAGALLFSACSKDPGEGGKAEVQGTIFQQEYNKNTGLIVGVPIPVAEQRVYIRYGDDTFASDDTRTEPDGTYRFPWLRKGSYTVYTYSECQENTCDGNQYPIYSTVEIGSRKEVVQVPLITVKWYD